MHPKAEEFKVQIHHHLNQASLPVRAMIYAMIYCLTTAMFELILPESPFFLWLFLGSLSLAVGFDSPQFWQVTGEQSKTLDILQRLSNCALVVLIYHFTGFWGTLALSSAGYELSVIQQVAPKKIEESIDEYLPAINRGDPFLYQETVSAIMSAIFIAGIVAIWTELTASILSHNIFGIIMVVVVGYTVYEEQKHLEAKEDVSKKDVELFKLIFNAAVIIAVSLVCFNLSASLVLSFWGVFWLVCFLVRVAQLSAFSAIVVFVQNVITRTQQGFVATFHQLYALANNNKQHKESEADLHIQSD